MKQIFQKFILVLAAAAVMFCTSSYASGTCCIKGCYKSTVSGGSYCSRHTCTKSGCKNYAARNGKCLSHAPKSSSSGKAGSGGTKYKSAGSRTSYGRSYSISGSRSNRSYHYKASDPYDVYDYNDPEDFYFDWEDDFEDFEDAEDYWESAW